MALLTAPEDRKAPVDARPSGLALRVRRRGEVRQRIVPLTAGKCTLGSSPQCQVCLSTPEVSPLQCLVTVEGESAVVTRWAKGVLLNGSEFSKAPARNGDRLTIGPWEIDFDGLPSFGSAAESREIELSATLPTTLERTPAPVTRSSSAAVTTPAAPAAPIPQPSEKIDPTSSHVFADRLI